MTEKIKDYFLRFVRIITPKTELDKRFEEINKLKDNPNNFGLVAQMYLNLQNTHSLLIGKGGDDNWNFLLSQIFGKQHKMYRELYFEYKSKHEKK